MPWSISGITEIHFFRTKFWPLSSFRLITLLVAILESLFLYFPFINLGICWVFRITKRVVWRHNYLHILLSHLCLLRLWLWKGLSYPKIRIKWLTQKFIIAFWITIKKFIIYSLSQFFFVMHTDFLSFEFFKLVWLKWNILFTDAKNWFYNSLLSSLCQVLFILH